MAKQSKTPNPAKIDNTQTQHHKVQFKKNDTLIYALGGLGEIGKNMYCFEQDDEILIVDAGVKFPDEHVLGVDYVIPDYTHLIQNNEKKKVLIVTHGHEDHIGGIPFLLQAVSIDAIYATKFTLALIERKLRERRLLNKTKLIPIDCNSSVKTKYFTCGFYDTTHSIPDSIGILITTDNGRIVETGDFKFDLTPIANNNSDYQKIAFIGLTNITLLMSDSTNASVDGFSISEKKVAQQILDVFNKCEGRIIVATFASNLYRVEQILEAAVKCGRKIVVFGRSMENVIDVGMSQGKIDIDEDSFIQPEEINHYPKERLCILCTGTQGEPLSALTRIASGTHRYIHVIPGDTIVFSSNPIPGNGDSVNEVINKLYRQGANVLTNSILNNLHTTGHASQSEEKLMLQLIKPKYFMPVHGEYKMLKMHAGYGEETGIPSENIFTLANGDVLIMRKGKIFRSNERFQADAVFVDGNDSSGISTAVLKDRQILGENGLVSVIVSIDSRKNEILSKPIIVSRGFVFIKESQSLLKEAEEVVYLALKEKMKVKVTFNDIKETIRSSLEPFLYYQTHRNPIVIPVILNSKEAIEEMQKKRSKR